MPDLYILYRDWLKERLSDPDEALAYLKVAIEEFEEDGDMDVFLVALHNVIEAQEDQARPVSSSVGS